LTAGNEIIATIDGSDHSITLHHNLSQRQIKTLMAGGAINWHDNREPGRVASNPAQPAPPAAEVQPRKQGGHQWRQSELASQRHTLLGPALAVLAAAPALRRRVHSAA
jgi:hypothetical protein